MKHHRTLAATLNSLIAGGFALYRIEEFAPTLEQIEVMQELAEDMEHPKM